MRSDVLTAVPDVHRQSRQNSLGWIVMYLAVIAFSAFMGLMAVRSAPAALPLPLVLLLGLLAVVVVRPVAANYAVVFLALCTDGTVSAWYPFVKNMSSLESILYMGNGFKVSPMELVLGTATLALVLRLLLDPEHRPFVRGALFRPMAVFTGFLLFGFVFGMGTGGDHYAGVWEFRPFLYLPVFYFLVTNLFTSRLQYRRLAMVALAAMLVHSALTFELLITITDADRATYESVLDHGSAIQMGIVLFIAIASLVLSGLPTGVRRLVPLAAIPIGWVWLVSERRAAVVALAAATVLLAILMVELDPRRLRRFGPVVVVVLVGYVAAFWGADEGLVGFPAQALKSVIAPDQLSDKDESSNIYRAIENYDISATIHAKPVTGLGFGHKFLRPIPLPDISFFPFYEFIPHNSLLWVWIKTGVGGFIALLYLFSATIRSGVRSVLALRRGGDLVMVLAALSYVVMYIVFSYVDIAWDPRSMITLAVAVAICGDYERLPPRLPATSARRPRTVHQTSPPTVAVMP